MDRFAAPAVLLTLAVVLVACPTLKLGSVTVADSAPKGATFTLSVDVTVEEKDATDGEEGQPASGKGVLGLHLPPTWTVTAARMKSPTEPVMRRLFASPQAAGVFADTFPTIENSWWAFSSPEQTIQQGVHAYKAEFDIEVSGKGGEIGLLMTILQDDMSDLPAPTQFKVAVKGKKVTLQPAVAAPAKGGGAKGDKVPAGK
jgi:hypothetical protein